MSWASVDAFLEADRLTFACMIELLQYVQSLPPSPERDAVLAKVQEYHRRHGELAELMAGMRGR